jgi:hypothetical protein
MSWYTRSCCHQPPLQDWLKSRKNGEGSQNLRNFNESNYFELRSCGKCTNCVHDMFILVCILDAARPMDDTHQDRQVSQMDP